MRRYNLNKAGKAPALKELPAGREGRDARIRDEYIKLQDARP